MKEIHNSKIEIVDNNVQYIKPKSKIKIKHLLTHTSGYGYQFLNSEIKYLVDNQLLQDLKDDGGDFLDAPILFEPGTRWNYGIGIDLLGHVIEKLSNQKLNDYMKENLFDKIGMKNTTFHLEENKFENLAYVYDYIDNKLMQKTASEIMTHRPKTIRPGALAAEALGFMNANKITCLFVTDGEQICGILHVHDILRAGIA